MSHPPPSASGNRAASFSNASRVSSQNSVPGPMPPITTYVSGIPNVLQQSITQPGVVGGKIGPWIYERTAMGAAAHTTGTTLPTPPLDASKPPPVQIIPHSGSQYLRFKRHNQTIFLHCEPNDLLSTIKYRLSLILGLDEEDIRLYENMPADKTQQTFALLEEKFREVVKQLKKKPGAPKLTIEEEIRHLTIPPLNEEKKLWELELDNDHIVFFVIRKYPKTDWDEWEDVNVPGYHIQVKPLPHMLSNYNANNPVSTPAPASSSGAPLASPGATQQTPAASP